MSKNQYICGVFLFAQITQITQIIFKICEIREICVRGFVAN